MGGGRQLGSFGLRTQRLAQGPEVKQNQAQITSSTRTTTPPPPMATWCGLGQARGDPEPSANLSSPDVPLTRTPGLRKVNGQGLGGAS
jgi:hypothetical protein